MELGLEVTLKIGIALSLLAVSFLFAFQGVARALKHGKRIERRLDAAATEPDSVVPSTVRQNPLARFGSHLSLPGPEEITRRRHELARAGFYSAEAVQIYYAVRFLAIIIPIGAILLFLVPLSMWLGQERVLLAVAFIAALGTFGPDMYLRRRMSARQRRCREGFPDMMDLLVASVEAGLGLDAALQRVAGELGGRHPDLKVDLDLMNLELRAGRTRTEALTTFSERVDLEEARAMGVMVKQAEEMGAGLGRALRAFSDDMREKRMLRAEEKAMALSAKLTVPLVIFIFPTLMVILMLPAAIRITESL